MCTLKILLCSLALASAHVTMEENHYGATGGYFRTYLKIPHGFWNGSEDFYTNKIVLTIPEGVEAVKPEAVPGWTTKIEEFDLAPEDQYLSHGNKVTKRPGKITWEAETVHDKLHNDHLMMIALQIKFGCKFDTSKASQTGTRDSPQPFTTWWPVEQILSHFGSFDNEHTFSWSDQDWANSRTPCPYIYICPGTRCEWAPVDGENESPYPKGGMLWHGAYYPKDDKCLMGGANMYNQIMSLIDGEMSDIVALQNQARDAHDDANQALAIGIAGIALATAALGFLFSLCLFRITAKQSFAEIVSAVPLTSTYADKAGAANKA